MDIEKARELKQSMMWAAVVEELNKKVHFEIQKLRTCEKDDLQIIQAKVNCFESLKKLPDDVIEREE